MSPNRSVLVIEAEHDLRVMIRSVLEGVGFFVVSAANGKDAIALLQNISLPAVVLVDSKLPIMPASEFMDFLKGHPSFSKIPTIQIKRADDMDLSGVCESFEMSRISKDLLPKVLKVLERQ